jgi:hypothetical protein
MQKLSGWMQLSFVVQARKHAEPLQVNGLHAIESVDMHWPVELHVDGG